MTTVFIDADGCPVVDIAIEIATTYDFEVILVCDTSHFFEKERAKTIVVSQGSDAVDFYIVNHVKKEDIVITQDYGLAAMVLARKALAINQNGFLYTDENMNSLLQSRHLSQKIRRSGGRVKGPSKRTEEQDEKFINVFDRLCKEVSQKKI